MRRFDSTRFSTALPAKACSSKIAHASLDQQGAGFLRAKVAGQGHTGGLRFPHRAKPHPKSTVTVSPAEAAATTVDVFNGGSTQGLAGQVSAALVKDGFTAGQVSNTSALTATQVLFGTGAAASGAKIASLFGVSATASAALAPGHVEVNLGATASVPSASASASPSNSATALPTTGAQGGAVIAKNGIPCVD